MQAKFLFLIIITSILQFFLTSCKIQKYLNEDQYLVKKTKVTILPKNKKINEIYNYVKPKPNSYFLGLFPLKTFLYFKYQNKNFKPTFLKKIITSTYEEPSYLKPEIINFSKNQIIEFLKLQGYFNSIIYDTVTYNNKKKTAIVEYKIILNQPLIIDSIIFSSNDEEILKIHKEEILKKTYLKPHKILTDELINKERERIEHYFRKNGFYYFNQTNVFFEIDTFNKKTLVNCIIKFNEYSKRQYYIDSVYIFYNFDYIRAFQEKEKYFCELDTIYYDNFSLVGNYKPKHKISFFNRFNFIQKNFSYDIDDAHKTYESFFATNNFKVVTIDFDTIKGNKLKSLIYLTPLPKHSYKIELESANSSGNIGFGWNFSYINRNLFGNAQNLTISNKFLVESQIFSKDERYEELYSKIYHFNIFEYLFEIKYNEPDFIIPIVSKEFRKNKKPSTILQFNYSFQHRPDYRRIITGTLLGVEWFGNKNLKYSIFPFVCNVASIPYMYWKFSRDIRGTFLEESFINHFELGSTFNVLFNDPKVGKNKSNILYIFSKFDIFGNILYIFKHNFSNDTLPYKLLNIPFSQYILLETDCRYYINLDFKKTSKLVYRLNFGIGIPYKNSNVLPFNKRFYVGGSNSLRGWVTRSLGPGNYIDTTSVIFNQTGDIKLEINTEYRFNMFWYIEGAFFIDIGNIWDIYKREERPNSHFTFNKFFDQLACSYGTGLRLNFDYFVLRLDIGLKGKDPAKNKQFLFIQRKFNFNYDLNFNFGIGYPF